MKIALYLQDLNVTEKKQEDNFYKTMKLVKSKKDIDLLVFPEDNYSPYDETLSSESIWEANGIQKNREIMLKISSLCDCAILFCKTDKMGVIYSFYFNPNAKDNETYEKIYYKHLATTKSAFQHPDYKKIIDSIFQPILLKGFLIGSVICHDSTFPLMSRMYGKKSVDIIINQTGGDVVYKKWSYYQKVRALENKCFTLCIMANKNNKKKSYVLGYNNFGKKLIFDNINEDRHYESGTCISEELYIYNFNKPFVQKYDDINNYEKDEYLDQLETENKLQHFEINPFSEALFSAFSVIDNNIYKKNIGDKNIVLVKVFEKDILCPEKILKLLYHNDVKYLENKRYIIYNEWSEIKQDYFNKILSNLFKVRAMENFCAVILKSNNMVKCYQTGKNKTPQVVKLINKKFNLDLERMSGQDSYFDSRNPPSWRQGYEYLIKYLNNDDVGHNSNYILIKK